MQGITLHLPRPGIHFRVKHMGAYDGDNVAPLTTGLASKVSYCFTHKPSRDVQRRIPVPSLLYGFKTLPPGNFPYGNSREIPEIREFPELREFPVLRESWEFPSHGKFPFLSVLLAHILYNFVSRLLLTCCKHLFRTAGMPYKQELAVMRC